MMTLEQYLRSHDLTQSEFAKRIGSSRAYVSEIVCGKKSASLRMALEIQAASGGEIDLASLLKSPSSNAPEIGEC